MIVSRSLSEIDFATGITEKDQNWDIVVAEEGMTKCVVEDDIDQSLLMPPSLHDWPAENHLARFIADFVRLWQVASRIRRSASAGRAEYGEQQVIGDALLAPGWIVHGDSIEA